MGMNNIKHIPTAEMTDESVEFQVPDLGELVESQFYNKVKNIYLDYKEKEMDKNNPLQHQNDKLMSISISYLSLISCLHDNSELTAEDIIYNKYNLNNDDITTIIKSCVKIWERDILSYFYDMSKENKNDYKKYAVSQVEILSRKKEVEEFMKIVQNHTITNAVRNYFLSGNKLQLEKIGLNFGDNIYEEAEYYVYSYLYEVYQANCEECNEKVEETGNVVKKQLYKLVAKYYELTNKNIIKNISVENAQAIVNEQLSEINASLYTEEEFLKLRKSRKDNTMRIHSFAISQYFYFEGIGCGKSKGSL